MAGAGSAGNISSLGGYFVEVKYFVDCVDYNHTPDRVTPEEAKAAVKPASPRPSRPRRAYR